MGLTCWFRELLGPKEQMIAHLLGLMGGLEDLPGVVFDHPDPVAKVGIPGAGLMADADKDPGDQGADLGSELFPGIGRGVEAGLEALLQDLPIHPTGMAGGMGELVQGRLVVAVGGRAPAPLEQGQ